MKMRHVKWTVKINLLGFFREKMALFFTILFPILLIVLFGFIFQDTDEMHVTMHVQDLDDTDPQDFFVPGVGNFTIPGSHNFTDVLKDIKNIDFVKVGKNVDVDEYMKDNDVSFLVIIPKGYQEALIEKMGFDPNKTVELTVKYDPSVSSTGVKMQILSSVIQEMNKHIAGAVDTVEIKEESIVSEKFEYIEFFLPGIIAFSIMASALFSTVTINTEFKQKGILRKLATTPLTRGEWILSMTLYQIFVGFLTTFILLFVGYLVFQAWLNINIFLPILVIVNVFAFAGLAMLVTGLVRDAQTAAAVANVVMFPMMFLSGTFFPVDQMPDFLQVIAKVMPLYYVNEGLRESMIFQDFEAAGMHTIVILVFAIIVFIAGIYLTSWKHD
jgi:ABC-2 type transport system permease protein